jgi:superfamily I DNA/RNA helicase
MTAPYLAALNPEQRRAVEYGVEKPSPLLVVAGAGCGKTNTLAHRVAHLIVQWPLAAREVGSTTKAMTKHIDIGARVKGMWR